MPETVFKSFWMGGYECTDQLNHYGNRVDLLTLTGHVDHIESDYDLLSQVNISTVREGIRWNKVEQRPYDYDFSTVGKMINAGKVKQIQQIWDICHFGYPDDLSPLHPHFERRFVSLCEAFVRFYRKVSPTTSTMKTTVVFVFLSIILSVIAQNTNSTVAPSCLTGGGDCSGRGVCQENGACRCYPGFTFPTVRVVKGVPVKSRIHCNATVMTGQPFMTPLVVVLRVEITILNFILFCLISYRLYLDFKLHGVSHAITKISLAFVACSTFLTFISNALDYWGIYGVMPPMCFFTFHSLIEWLLVGVFCAIVLHWVNIYDTTVKSIRRQEMIKKINSNYDKPISVEDIVRSVTLVRIFRLPYLTVTGVTLVIFVVRVFLTPLWTSVNGYAIWYKFFNTWHCILWGLFGICFALYGYRLVNVMPETSSKKIKQVTWKLCIVAVICTINALMMILLDNYQPVFPSLHPSVGLITRNWITFNTRTMVAAVVLDIHMPFAKLKQWLSGGFSKSGSGSKSDSNTATTQIEMYVSTPSNPVAPDNQV